MKKYLSIIKVVVLLFLVSSCETQTEEFSIQNENVKLGRQYLKILKLKKLKGQF